MAENNLAEKWKEAPDFLAEDDPLAELARLVGYDEQPAAAPSRSAALRPTDAASAAAVQAGDAAPRREPVLALEDELLREFARYDAPRLDPAYDLPPEPVADLVEPVREIAEESVAPVFDASDYLDPGAASQDAPSHQADAYDRSPYDEPAYQEPAAGRLVYEGPDIPFDLSPEPAFDVEPELDLAPAGDVAAVEPVAAVAQAVEPVADSAGHIEPFFDFSDAAAEYPSKASEVDDDALDDVGFDLVAELESSISVDAPEAGLQAESLSKLRDAGYDWQPAPEEIAVISESASDDGAVFAPVTAATAPAVAYADASVAAPAAAPQLPAARAEEDGLLFSDADFEMALDGLELDLAEILEDDAHRNAPEIAVAAPQPAASVAPAVAAGGEVAFDPSEITEAEEPVVAVADFDVPALPAVEPEAAAVGYEQDFDLDIDAELAAMFNAQSASLAVDAAPAVAAASVQPNAAPVITPASSYADLDEFERALEEDFRRSLSAPPPPLDPGDSYVGGEGDYAATVEKARRSARDFALPAAVLAVVLLSGYGAWSWLGSPASPSRSGGEPVVIAAESDPIKVAPENPGGRTVPNQDKAVYDRVAGVVSSEPAQESLISSSEEPVDVVQRTLLPENLPGDGMEADDDRLLPSLNGEQASLADAEQQPVTLAPRRVRTMIVRADGSLVEQESTAATTPSNTAAAALPSEPVLPVATSSAVPAAQVPASDASLAELASLAADAGAVPVAASDAATELSQTAARPVATARSGAATQGARPVASAPVPTARPAEQPVNVVAAVSEQGNIRATTPASQPVTTAAAEPVANTQVPPGGYVIQIASLPSEADARRSYQALSSRYGNVIGGRGVDIRQAQIPGKGTFYRVRIPAGSRADANALCERYRAAGGSCLVAR